MEFLGLNLIEIPLFGIIFTKAPLQPLLCKFFIRSEKFGQQVLISWILRQLGLISIPLLQITLDILFWHGAANGFKFFHSSQAA